jgi:hypothetical protein
LHIAALVYPSFSLPPVAVKHPFYPTLVLEKRKKILAHA